MFDPSKPYGKVLGDCGDARFEQAGKLYDSNHREVRLIESRVRDDNDVVSVVVKTELVQRAAASEQASDADEAPKKRGRPANVASE